MKVIDWLRDNWQKRVIGEKLSATEVSNVIAQECGIERVTDNNVRKIVYEVFPQWNFSHALQSGTGGIVGLRDTNSRIDSLETQIAELNRVIDGIHQRMSNLERELGVRPLTAILPESLRRKV